MPRSRDPTEPMAKKARTFPGVTEGTSCNQTAFKVGKSSFLFVGSGAKGQGFKAMLKLDSSLPQAKKLAAKEPDRIEAGSTGWVTMRFTAEKPIPKSVWEKWLKESYELFANSGAASKVTKKKTPKKKTSAKR